MNINLLFINLNPYMVFRIIINTLCSYPMSWTEEKVAKLKELWGKGNTASQIAEIIGGISRNAVIGKAHRLNLSAKIKTRSASVNHASKTFQENDKIKPARGRRNKFKIFNY